MRGKVKVRMIARIRVKRRDDESSTVYYAYVDGERYVLSRNLHLLLRVAGRYQQVSANMASTMLWIVRLLGLAAAPTIHQSIE